MIVLDTSGLLAALDASQPSHKHARTVLEDDPGPYLLSPFVLAELDYLLSRRVGPDAQLALLREVTGGSYTLEPFSAEEVEIAAEVIETYRDQNLGLADASIAVLAARHDTTRVLTLDERHFRAIRPLQGGAFTILPAEAS